jgi:hypothetical protein
MKKWIIYLLFFILPILNRAGSDNPNSTTNEKSMLFSEMQLSEYGLSEQIFQIALKGFRELENKKKLQNSSIITIIDYSQSSNKKRLYVVDLVKKMLLFNTYVAHGRNTGEEYAQHFSNETGSLKSSLGFYITENPSVGSKVGPSLIIKGVEKGFNDNALQREIIMHGAAYATEAFIRKNGRLGRSFGCPSVPPEMIRPISETIKGGTCLFIYSPDNNYLCKSPVLQQANTAAHGMDRL